MSANGHRVPNPNARFEAPVDCFCPPTEVPLDPSVRSRAVDRTDSAEKAALARAESEARTLLRDEQRRLHQDMARLGGSGEAAIGAIEEVERLADRQAVAQAFRDLADLDAAHASDGAEDLRRVPGMWRCVHPVTAVAAGVFEASFVAVVVRQLLDASGPEDPNYWLAFLPGIGVAVCLVALGRLVAVHGFRRKLRARRVASEQRGAVPAVADEAPKPRWFGPIVGMIVMGGAIAAWAWLRFTQENDSDVMEPSFAFATIALMLVLAAAAVVATAMTYNPRADAYRRARSRSKRVHKQVRRQLAAARKKLTKHQAVWTAVDAAARLAEDRARRRIDDTVADLMDRRATTGVAGALELPHGALPWLFPGSRGCRHRRSGAAAEGADGDAQETRPPRLDDIRGVLARYRPEDLNQRLDRTAEAVNAQWRGPGSAPEASSGPDPVPDPVSGPPVASARVPEGPR